MASKFKQALSNSKMSEKGTETRKAEREMVDDQVIENLGHIQLDSDEVKFRIREGLLMTTIKTHTKKQEAKDRNLLKAMIKQQLMEKRAKKEKNSSRTMPSMKNSLIGLD